MGKARWIFAAGRGRLLALALAVTISGCGLFRPPLPDTIPVHHAAATEGFLHAGAAAVEITPDENLYMAGYDPHKRAIGVHDPLYARAVVLDRGGFRTALVVLDVIGLQGPDVAAIREGLPELPPEHVIVAATHTHGAPDTMGLWGWPPFIGGKDDAYMKKVIAGARAAILNASDALQPAVMASAAVPFDPEGILYNLRRRGFEDHRLTGVHIRAQEGGTIATVVEIGCHPEVLGPENRWITADYAHGVVTELERVLGGTGVYVSGALGGLVTPDVPRSDDWGEGGTFEEAEALGKRIAEIGIGMVRGFDRYEISPRLEVRHVPLYIENENFLYDLMRFTGVLDRTMYRGGYLRTEVNLWRWGALHLATVPGEITPDLGLRIKALSGDEPMLLVGLGNDELGYLLPEWDYDHPMYSYERTLCPNRNAGVRVLERLRDLSLLEELSP